ncbi:MAG: hypothetical protein JRE82_09425, partial [Deltaproteobacteria bacterium]|nr:hypothetical protein [Deltaproteobacteria bacterium]
MGVVADAVTDTEVHVWRGIALRRAPIVREHDLRERFSVRVLCHTLRMPKRPTKYWLMKSEPGTYSIDDLERDG